MSVIMVKREEEEEKTRYSFSNVLHPDVVHMYT